jgi:glycosyltransferase involved in cell wall biosynthesis
LFILASDFEGLPMVIIEAMSYKKPIVASNVGGISEIVRNEENGYVVNNKAKEFAQRIKEILEDQELYNKFARNSYLRFENELTVEKMVNSYLELYKK